MLGACLSFHTLLELCVLPHTKSDLFMVVAKANV